MARQGQRGRTGAGSDRAPRRGAELNISLQESDRVAGGRSGRAAGAPASGKGAKRGKTTRGRADPVTEPKPRSRGLFGRGRGKAAPVANARGGRRRRKRRGGVFGFLRIVMRTTFMVGLVGFIAVLAVLGYFAAKLPNVTSWEVPERPPNLKIVAADGSLIANRGDTGGEAIKIADLPPFVPRAVIAIEDRRFYTHFGVDPVGLLRAAARNFTAGDVVQGGSTLTQQLAKNLFLNPERTIERKVQEVVMALWLEARYSKDEILEMYLNRVYLGAGAYGIDAAAHRYFGKPASELSLLEAATIAGLLKAPSRYAPTTNPDAALSRARVVLAAMREAGFITQEEEKTASAGTLVIPKQVAEGSAGYVADWVADLVPRYVGAVSGDITVETTIDLKLQAAAAEAVKEGIDNEGKDFGVHQGALVSMSPDGAVRALVGGRDYTESQYDRAVNARRQPGSSFKPFVYLTALEYGLAPETIRVDGPIDIQGWQPENYAHDYRGPVTLQRALALSLNTIAAQLTQEVTPEAVVDTAHRLGISSPIQAVPSVALGTSEVSVLEMTGAFAPFANGGTGVIPYVISRITSATDGRVLYDRTGTGTGEVIQPQYVAMMNSMLKETLETGTGKKAVVKGWQAGGKTGTSQEWRDAWFIGYTAHLVTGVWFGNDDNSPTAKASGGNMPAAVWSRYMTVAHQGVQVANLPGDYQFRDPAHFAADGMPPQDIIGPGGRYNEYVDRYERLEEPQFDGAGDPADGYDWRNDPAFQNDPALVGQAPGDPGALPPEDPNYDPRFDARADGEYDPRYDPNYDPRFDPRYDPALDPNADPNLMPATDPRFEGAPVAGPVPPAAIQPPVQQPLQEPPRREGGFIRRLFGG